MVGEGLLSEALVGMGLMSIIIALGILLLFILAAIYVYHALVWQTIAKKLKHKYPWLAWIPFANASMILQLGGFHWAWIFLVLIPIFGWIAIFVLLIISSWRILRKRKYPGGLSLLLIPSLIPYIGIIFGIAYMVILGFVAWKDK
jgi:hypothetical protein